ncbi:MAG: hypothetical protein ACI9WU_002061, partial [Myxococcota bacterium]
MTEPGGGGSFETEPGFAAATQTLAGSVSMPNGDVLLGGAGKTS